MEDELLNWELVDFHVGERYALEHAKNSREAITRLQTTDYDIVLLDIQLSNSDLNGTEVAQLIRGTYPSKIPAYATSLKPSRVPIIFMTAYSGLYKKEDIIKFGGDELVYKPVDFTYLATVITRMLMKMITEEHRR